MFIGQFPSDDCVAIEPTDRVTRLSDHRRSMVGRRVAEKDDTPPSKPSEVDPFPKVDDIIDRLTNDTKVADLRVRAR